jgi:hypothetical protein
MPDTHSDPGINLHEISAKNTFARNVIAGFRSGWPKLADWWQAVDDALSDSAALCEQVTRLSADLERTRLDRANLRAAMRAALAAHAEGEADPLWYLRDELDAAENAADASRGPK